MIDIPTRSGEYRVNSWEIESYQKVYPGLNVETEVRKMKQWALANPRKRKTERGMKRFVVNWLNRASENVPQKHSETNGFYAHLKSVQAQTEAERQRHERWMATHQEETDRARDKALAELRKMGML